MKRILLGTLFLLAASSVSAAGNPIVWNGGITIDERASAPKDGTRLEFFIKAGNFLSDIAVVISDENGSVVVNTTTDGPWLILDLNPGRYQVIARRKNGDTQSLVIDVTDASQQFGFAFPD